MWPPTQQDLNTYGLLGLALMFFIKDVWPVLSKRVSKERDHALKQEAANREWERDQVERSTMALETLAATMPVVAVHLSEIKEGQGAIKDGVLKNTEQLAILLDRKATTTTLSIPLSQSGQEKTQ